MSRRCLFFLLPLTALMLMGCPVSPGIPVSEITVSIDQNSYYNINPIPVNGMLQLQAEIFPEEAGKSGLVWSSDDEVCASVDEDGLVTGLAASVTVIIRATSISSGTFGVLKVTVRLIKKIGK